MNDFTQAPFSPVHKKMAAGTFTGMLSDGYAVGIIGISLSYAQQTLHLTSAWQGLIGSGTIFGAVIGSFLAGAISDKFGRKLLYTPLMALMALISIWQFWLSDPFWLASARICLGLITGSDYAVSITLLSEWTPEQQREKITSLLIVFWTLGYTLSYITGFFMDGVVTAFGDNGWRLILCTSAIPAIIACLIRLGSPESPVWLTAKNRTAEAAALIAAKLGQYNLPITEKTQSGSWFGLFSTDQWRKTTVACVFFFAQFLPFYAISIFLPMILAQIGMTNPHASGALYNAFTLLGVLIGSWLYTVLTRRAFLLWTFYLAAILLAAPLVWPAMPSLFTLAFVIAFAMVIAASLIPEFTYPAELFPTELRGSGVGLTIAVGDLGAAAGTFLLPVASANYGIHAPLWACVGILIFGGIICQMWAPETSIRHNKNT